MSEPSPTPLRDLLVQIRDDADKRMTSPLYLLAIGALAQVDKTVQRIRAVKSWSSDPASVLQLEAALAALVGDNHE